MEQQPTVFVQNPAAVADQTVADRINKGMAIFEERKATLTALREQAQGLKVASVEDRETLALVAVMRKKLKTARVEIEKEGKLMRDHLTDINRKISFKEKELIALILPTEKELMQQEQWVEGEKQRIRKEEAEAHQLRMQSRIDQLAEYGFKVDYMQLEGLGDEDFSKVVQKARVLHEEETASKQEANRLRLEAEERERQALEQEKNALEKQRWEQAEKEKQLQIQLEQLQKDADAARKKRLNNRANQLMGMGLKYNGSGYSYKSVIVDYKDITEAEEDAWDGLIEKTQPLLAEIKAEEVRLQEETQTRLQQEQAERDETIRKEATEKALRDKADAERLLEEERLEKVAQGSDKEKFKDLYERLGDVTVPEMKSPRGKKIASEVQDRLEAIRTHIHTTILKPKVATNAN